MKGEVKMLKEDVQRYKGTSGWMKVKSGWQMPVSDQRWDEREGMKKSLSRGKGRKEEEEQRGQVLYSLGGAAVLANHWGSAA